MADSERPYIIVHMMTSLDGRIQPRRWSGFETGTIYEETHAALKGDAWMCGRITMQGYTRGEPADDRDPTPVPREDFVARRDATDYAVALDFHGRLHWGARNDIEGDHVVVVLSARVPDQHLNALRQAGISYVFAGSETLDLARAVQALRRHFGIERLLVEGGGAINGSFLQAGLVDEISLLLAPTVDGGRGVPALFDAEDVEGLSPGATSRLRLEECQALDSGMVRLRYVVHHANG